MELMTMIILGVLGLIILANIIFWWLQVRYNKNEKLQISDFMFGSDMFATDMAEKFQKLSETTSELNKTITGINIVVVGLKDEAMNLKSKVEEVENDTEDLNDWIKKVEGEVESEVDRLEKEKAFEKTLADIKAFIAKQKSPVTKEKLSAPTVDNYMKAIKAFLSGKELNDKNPRHHRALVLYNEFLNKKGGK